MYASSMLWWLPQINQSTSMLEPLLPVLGPCNLEIYSLSFSLLTQLDLLIPLLNFSVNQLVTEILRQELFFFIWI